MDNNKLEFITARLKAINKIPFLLDTIESTKWDFTAICRIFVDTVGYKSCWIVLIDDSGGIKNFSKYASNELFKPASMKITGSFLNSFIQDVLIQPSDSILNQDPILDYVDPSALHNSEKVNSITIKLSYNNIIFGVLSVTLFGDYHLIKEEFLIISDVVKTIAYFLYDMDYRDKIKSIFLTMFETTGTGTILIEEDTIISYANKEFVNMSGFSKDEIEGKKSWTEFIVQDDLNMMLEYHRLRRIDPNSAPRNYEFRFIDHYGKIKNIYMTIDMVPRTKMSIGSFMNITDKKRLESEVLKISEQERQQIGNDLHDGLGPHLVGIKFILKILKQKIEKKIMPQISDIEEIEDLLTQAIDQTRTLIKGLKPVDIQSDGLIFALKDLTEKSRSIFGISCNLIYDKAFSIDNNIVATHLYYIVKEALNNAVKHGKPSKIEVILKSNAGNLSVEIQDNGTGNPKLFDSDKGLGLNNMKYRASIINAQFDILQNKTGGTAVICVLKK